MRETYRTSSTNNSPYQGYTNQTLFQSPSLPGSYYPPYSPNIFGNLFGRQRSIIDEPTVIKIGNFSMKSLGIFNNLFDVKYNTVPIFSLGSDGMILLNMDRQYSGIARYFLSGVEVDDIDYKLKIFDEGFL